MQNGVYLKFFVLESQRVRNQLAYDWLLDQAKDIGLHGGSAFRAIAGFGRHGIRHESHFFELAGELPLEVGFVASREDAQRLIDRVHGEGLSLLYFLVPIEYGRTGLADT